MSMASLAHWWATTPTTELIWITIGFIAQFHVLDALHRAVDRFRKGAGQHRAGDVLVFQLGRRRRCCSPTPSTAMDPVFILGQAAGLVIYARNIYFIWLGKREPSPAEIA